MGGHGVRYRSGSAAKQPEEAFTSRSGCAFLSAIKQPTNKPERRTPVDGLVNRRGLGDLAFPSHATHPAE